MNDGGEMKPERELSPEEKAQLHRELEEIFFGHRRRRPRAVLVCLGGRVVGEATVVVGPLDPNWRAGGEIKVDIPNEVLKSGEGLPKRSPFDSEWSGAKSCKLNRQDGCQR